MSAGAAGRGKPRLLALACTLRLLAAAALLGPAAGVAATPAPAPASPLRPPLVIAPVVEGLLVCDNLASNPLRHLIDGNSWCAGNGRDGVRTLKALLDHLEPGGAAGRVQVGYTITLQLLSLYRADSGGRWVIDEARVEQVLTLLREVDRPAVLYLAANHFDSQGAITASLLADKRNLLLLADGNPPMASYFGYQVVPYTLSTDESLPVNHYRFAALRHVAARVMSLPTAARGRLVGIALGGEVHHLFPDFEGGMGNHDQARVTDYSEASVRDFRKWLGRKYGSVEKLNAATGGSYLHFDQVLAPFRSAVADSKVPTLEHYDGYAGGTVPVSGWLWDPQERVQSLELLVNGSRHAKVERGFNRLDVYRAVQGVQDPNVGYRHDLDISTWARGSYSLQVVAQSASGRHEIAQVQLNVGGPPRSRISSAVERGRAWLRALWHRSLPGLAGVSGSLDLPGAGQQVLFNPLARDWNAFRSQQVLAFMHQLFQIANQAGLPVDKLYSHQILSRVNSTWNPDLFATDGSIGSGLPWKQGFNTYGGAAASPWTLRLLKQGGMSDYGVPEFHLQQWKKPQSHREALELHLHQGARFVSPYFMSVISDRDATMDAAVKQLEIRPNNSKEGSDRMHAAILELARQ